MKTKRLLYSGLIAIMLTSCGSTSFYQVYKAMPSDKLIIKDSSLVYEDVNCKISYNLWSEGGNVGFKFLNKTEKNIYLNLGESFFILNGISYDYYKNRVYTTSRSSGTMSSIGNTASKSVTGLNYADLIQTNKVTATNSIGLTTASGISVSYNEEEILCIPPKTSKFVSEYAVTESIFRDCDLLRYPTKKQIRSKTFTKEKSPYVFSNRISYALGQNDNLVRIENEFYVKEIYNMPESEMIEYKYNNFCGEKDMTLSKFFKNISVDKFYIKYGKGLDTRKY